jgi:pimeloyl-ACP methyl ester carboxylesterase
VAQGPCANRPGQPSASGALPARGSTLWCQLRPDAATGNDQVQALVYLNGWMPDEGESIQSLIESDIFQGSLIHAALRPLAFTNPDGSEGVDLYLDQDLFREAFAGDVDEETAGVMAAAQRPWSAGAAAGPSGKPAFRSIPSWYLLGTDDRAIPPAAQRFMAERGASTIQEVPASHASFVSQPEAVTQLILTAVTARPAPAFDQQKRARLGRSAASSEARTRAPDRRLCQLLIVGRGEIRQYTRGLTR